MSAWRADSRSRTPPTCSTCATPKNMPSAICRAAVTCRTDSWCRKTDLLHQPARRASCWWITTACALAWRPLGWRSWAGTWRCLTACSCMTSARLDDAGARRDGFAAAAERLAAAGRYPDAGLHHARQPCDKPYSRRCLAAALDAARFIYWRATIALSATPDYRRKPEKRRCCRPPSIARYRCPYEGIDSILRRCRLTSTGSMAGGAAGSRRHAWLSRTAARDAARNGVGV